MIQEIKVWLTTHRLVLWNQAVVVIPLSAIGTITFTHVIHRSKIGWAILFTILTAIGIGAAVFVSQSTRYSPLAHYMGDGIVICFIVAAALWSSVSGPWLLTIHGIGGQSLAEYRLPRRYGDQVLRLAAGTADAIVRILPVPVGAQPATELPT